MPAQIPTFTQNVEAFANAMGPMRAPLIIDLAQAHWQTSVERDDFIDALVTPEEG